MDSYFIAWACEKPNTPQRRKPTLPIKFQNPTESQHALDWYTWAWAYPCHRLQVDSPCHPMSSGLGFHHLCCTSRVRTTLETIKPTEPITGSVSH